MQKILILLLIVSVGAQESTDPRCGTADTDYAPCVELDKVGD